MLQRRWTWICAGALALYVACSPGGIHAQIAEGPVAGRGGTVSTVPGDELRVWLVTAGPGDAVWERYGHNAIRVLNTSTGRDASYNWGIFDFQQVDFIPRFLQGRMLYMMAPFQTQAMIDSYARADREVVMQELDLTPTQKIELLELAETNARPGNRDYYYQYFRDNCSTRVRDLLDVVLDGALKTRFGSLPSGTSYRDHTRRLTQVDPVIYTGMDLLLGAPTDAPISVWEEMFLPLTLRDEIRSVELTGADGVPRALVLGEQTPVRSTKPAEESTPPRWFWAYLLLGLSIGGAFSTIGSARVRSSAPLRRSLLGLAVLWSGLGGLAGTILLLLLLTDHSFAYWNENLFLFNPLMLSLVVLLPMSSSRALAASGARAVARLIAGIGLLGLAWQLLPLSIHSNGMFFALALPAHLALVWATREAGAERREATP